MVWDPDTATHRTAFEEQTEREHHGCPIPADPCVVMLEGRLDPDRPAVRLESMGLAVTMADDRSDLALVAAALAEPTAFGAIYTRHWLAVFRYLRALGCDEELALDLTATTFERAMVSLAGYRGSGGGLGAWLMRIARNARIDAHRRTARQIGLDAAEDLAGTGGPDGSDAELRLLVAQLPEPTREAIGLRYAAGLTAAEIGRVIGKRPEAVQKLIARGLATLREAYRDR